VDSASSESREHGTLVFVCRQGRSRCRRGRGRFFPRGLFTVCGCCWVILLGADCCASRCGSINKRITRLCFELSGGKHYIYTVSIMTDLGVV
jgi:hypothetical protein